MDLSKFIPAIPLMAWFPVGAKGFEVQLRHLSPGELRRMVRESLDYSASGGKPRFSEANYEISAFAASVQNWRGLTLDALAELIPGIDISAGGELPPGHQFPFDAATLRSLTDHSPEFYRVVNASCASLAAIRARQKEEELKNSATAQGTSSGPAQSAAEGAGK